MNRKRVVVVCPGRGSYTRETSNYLSNPLADMDEYIKMKLKMIINSKKTTPNDRK